ncbi:DUF4124 domain-containing protein [Ramlibacter sp. PS4R-6]|uniref:DUF4124 domain-containing protein n=1 Tax=Ramlibacter sp. PS4R-6 TaxID=3133438 RepID=UPI0030A3F660
MRGWLGSFIAAAIWAGSLPGAWAQGGIYTCVDAKGRRLTSDRPIIDCIDREQNELSPSGKVLRKIGPSMTAEERAAEEEKQRKALEEKARIEEEKRRDRALLSRFPDRAAHDKERNIALGVVDEVIKAALRRVSELQWQRKKLDAELEFYKGDVQQAPVNVKRQIEGNEQQVAAQKRFIANQEEEKKRINARFDEEAVRLKPLWAQHAVPTAARSASAPAPAAKK